jgi:hypothetical protein
MFMEASPMRERLLGYLFGALDDAETLQVEMALADPRIGAALRRDLDALRRAVKPLELDRQPLQPPPGLAGRTLRFIATQAAPARSAPGRPVQRPVRRPVVTPAETERSGGRRAWLDRAIIAATALAACVLVAPLLLDSIADARSRRAERNLQRLSGGLQGYAESHRIYPTPPSTGPLSRAGLYAPTLVSEQRLLADDGTVLVPDTELARRGGFRVPSLEEVEAAVGTPRFDELVRTMGGDFGYTLGHRDAAGVLQPNRNQRRTHHPLMADAPDHTDEQSDNHPEGIHHVLFEDGHVKRLLRDGLHHRDDHLYRNHDGQVAAGKDVEDAVIGDSHDRP